MSFIYIPKPNEYPGHTPCDLAASNVYGFIGPYEFLSNFYPSPFLFYDGIVYPTAEHAYQAQKTSVARVRNTIAALKTPGAAKRYGKKLPLPYNWEHTRVSTMLHVVAHKFNDPVLQDMLINTGTMYLEETNTWGDVFWGICNGSGENRLGVILMYLRSCYNSGRRMSTVPAPSPF